MATKFITAVIIGSGAGGSMAALALAQSGRFDRITVLEKGPNYYQGLGRPNFSDMSVAFSNDVIKFGQRAGPGASSDSLDDPDVLLDPRSFRTSTGVAREFVGDVQSLPQLRSEEHTSELQSLRHLVCRLLLEKKKKNKMQKHYSKKKIHKKKDM